MPVQRQAQTDHRHPVLRRPPLRPLVPWQHDPRLGASELGLGVGLLRVALLDREAVLASDDVEHLAGRHETRARCELVEHGIVRVLVLNAVPLEHDAPLVLPLIRRKLRVLLNAQREDPPEVRSPTGRVSLPTHLVELPDRGGVPALHVPELLPFGVQRLLRIGDLKRLLQRNATSNQG